ncbi:MAG: ribonuclease H-like domain-containing protein [Lachnospiraceae bacterium]|nr:ribonuclease H-like domain-containing protein [Lachnospiraceae bacterium]
MRTLRQTIPSPPNTYPLEKITHPDKILFLDIETTGFTAKSSYLYLIGTAYCEKGQWFVKQWFANDYREERKILSAFFQFAMNYTHLIHFNGNNFDLPYLVQKCKQYDLPYTFYRFEGIDIYRRVSPYKSLLPLDNCKLKTIEQFLGIQREDRFSGGELISVYHDYVKNPTDFALQALTLHNAEDIAGMLQILPILAYHDLFIDGLSAQKVQANYYYDLDGQQKQELVMKLTLPTPLPHPFSLSSNNCYFQAQEEEGSLRVPMVEEEMKYFYSNYKSYYYLPEEDTAIHKSVASFVDKSHRTQAMAATCYTKKFSTYLPQWEVVFEPFFKREYHSKELFFELTEDIKKDRQLFSHYASHVLQMMLQHNCLVSSKLPGKNP